MRKIRIGILGAGGIAKKHVLALAGDPRAEIKAVCDVNRQSASALADIITQSSSAPAVFMGFQTVLEKCPLDALYVCLPPFAHDGQIELAAAKGIHLFCEKPIALTVERAESMVAAAEKHGIVHQVGYHNRFGSAVRLFKQYLDDGSTGQVTLFDGRYACNALHAPWWRKREMSGGQILEQVIHTYDMAMFFCGEAQTVVGMTGNLCHLNVEDYTVEDTSASLIRFKSGALCSIVASNCSIPNEWTSAFTVICRNMTAHFSDPNHAEFIYHYELDQTGRPRRERVNSDLNMYAAESKIFLDAVASGSPSPVNLREGLRSMLIVDAVTRSSISGLPIEMTCSEVPSEQ